MSLMEPVFIQPGRPFASPDRGPNAAVEEKLDAIHFELMQLNLTLSKMLALQIHSLERESTPLSEPPAPSAESH